MARWLKGIAHLSAFEAIEQIKNAKDEEEKKRLIQKEWERRKKIRQMTNMMVVIGSIINLVATPMLFLRIKQRVFDIMIPDHAVSVTVSVSSQFSSVRIAVISLVVLAGKMRQSAFLENKTSPVSASTSIADSASIRDKSTSGAPA